MIMRIGEIKEAGMSSLTSRGGYSSGYGHFCRYHHYFSSDVDGWYEIGWQYDCKLSGSRLRFTRTTRRSTDEKGARKFCKKWGLQFPGPEEKSK